MIKTAGLLMATLVALPLIAFYFDEGLTPLQLEILKEVLYIYLAVASLCFLLSEWTRNYSQVDKIWSLIPIVYAWHIAAAASFTPRTVLMAILVSIWGLRLTFNFARRGGYSWRFWQGEEDYRWAELQQTPAFKGKSHWNWRLFNLFFISFYQNGLILLFTLPILATVRPAAAPLFWGDFVLAAAFLLFVLFETIADEQQWRFQREKYRRIANGQALGEAYQQGFVQTGLWRWVRHPNYASEQAIWIVFYGFSILATGLWLNWSITGCVLLILLFIGSADFSERISARKYPAYTTYIQQTPRFVPWPGRR